MSNGNKNENRTGQGCFQQKERSTIWRFEQNSEKENHKVDGLVDSAVWCRDMNTKKGRYKEN